MNAGFDSGSFGTMRGTETSGIGANNSLGYTYPMTAHEPREPRRRTEEGVTVVEYDPENAPRYRDFMKGA